MTSSFENNTLTISYGKETDRNAEYYESPTNELTEDVNISVEIRHLLTNTMIYETVSTNDELLIYTDDWKPGMYIVTAKAKDEVLTKKILIK